MVRLINEVLFIAGKSITYRKIEKSFTQIIQCCNEYQNIRISN